MQASSSSSSHGKWIGGVGSAEASSVRNQSGKKPRLAGDLGHWGNLVRMHIHSLKYELTEIKAPFKSKEDIEKRCKFYMEAQALDRVISHDVQLSDLKKELEEVLKVSKKVLTKMQQERGLMGDYFKRAWSQYHVKEGEGVYYPHQDHLGRNEDAFKHSNLATVVADGLGGHIYSEAASRIVVKELHQKACQIVEEYSGQSIKKEEIQDKMVQACIEVEETLQNALEELPSATTCSLEMRIPDDQGKVHRFLLFVGDANNLLKKKDGKAIYLNPFCYKKFLTRKQYYNETTKKVPVLKLSDIEALNRLEVDTKRDVVDCLGCFIATGSRQVCPNSLAIVYLSPEETGETILMTDGITDRSKPEDITLETPHKVFLLESMMMRYNSSEAKKNRATQEIESKLNFLLSGNDSVSNLGRITPAGIHTLIGLKSALRYCIGINCDARLFVDYMKRPIKDFFHSVGWSDSKEVMDAMIAFLYKASKFASLEEVVEYRNRAIHLIYLDGLGCSKMGFESLSKYSDDSTFVPSTSKDSETQDLETHETVPFLTKALFENGSELSKKEIVEILEKLNVWFNKIKNGEADEKFGSEKVRMHIAVKIVQARLKHPNLTEVMDGLKRGSKIQKFLTEELGISLEKSKKTHKKETPLNTQSVEDSIVEKLRLNGFEDFNDENKIELFKRMFKDHSDVVCQSLQICIDKLHETDSPLAEFLSELLEIVRTNQTSQSIDDLLFLAVRLNNLRKNSEWDKNDYITSVLEDKKAHPVVKKEIILIEFKRMMRGLK